MADCYKGQYNGLPDRDVRTIRDLIRYQYAKIIARSAFSVPDGATTKGNYYGFIKQTFRELHNKLFTYLRTSPRSHLNAPPVCEEPPFVPKCQYFTNVPYPTPKR